MEYRLRTFFSSLMLTTTWHNFVTLPIRLFRRIRLGWTHYLKPR